MSAEAAPASLAPPATRPKRVVTQEQREAIRRKLQGKEQPKHVVEQLKSYAAKARNDPDGLPLCTVCGKPLFGEAAIKRGMGPICAGLKPRRVYQAKYTPEERAAKRAARDAEKAAKVEARAIRAKAKEERDSKTLTITAA